jgi:hypothetical protein
MLAALCPSRSRRQRLEDAAALFNFSLGRRVYGDVRLKLHGVALLALTATACGGHSATTTLTIEVNDNAGVRAYRLECGTVRNSVDMCKALRRQPDMRATARYSICGPGVAPSESIDVRGSYRGKRVHAAFEDVCSVGNDGFGEWSDLLYAAGPGFPKR